MLTVEGLGVLPAVRAAAVTIVTTVHADDTRLLGEAAGELGVELVLDVLEAGLAQRVGFPHRVGAQAADVGVLDPRVAVALVRGALAVGVRDVQAAALHGAGEPAVAVDVPLPDHVVDGEVGVVLQVLGHADGQQQLGDRVVGVLAPVRPQVVAVGGVADAEDAPVVGGDHGTDVLRQCPSLELAGC